MRINHGIESQIRDNIERYTRKKSSLLSSKVLTRQNYVGYEEWVVFCLIQFFDTNPKAFPANILYVKALNISTKMCIGNVVMVVVGYGKQ